VVGIADDACDVLLRLEFPGGEMAAEEPPNGSGESLLDRSKKKNNEIVRDRSQASHSNNVHL